MKLYLKLIALNVRVGATFYFFALALLELLLHQWSDGAFHLMISVGVCPVWDDL